MGRRSRKARSKGEDKGDGKEGRRMSSNPKEDEVKEPKGEPSGEGKAAEISNLEPTADSETVNPLLISLIIEKIFQHICPKPARTWKDSIRYRRPDPESSVSLVVAKNVQNLRLVCKQWKDIATRLYLVNRAPIMSFGQYGRAPFKSSEEKMKNFLDAMKNSGQIPIQRYNINSNFFLKENQQLMQDFMRICGPHAVKLNLSCYNSNETISTKGIFPDLNLTSLKKLTFRCKDKYEDEEDEADEKVAGPPEIAYLIEDILTAAGTLQEFEFNAQNLESITVTQRFGEGISKLLPKTVKILRLRMPLNYSHWITLAESELKLEQFGFDAQDIKSSMAIRKFFENQAATLKVLYAGQFGSQGPSNFPRFEELQYLNTNGRNIQQVSFPDTFPKLTSLNISWWKIEQNVELLNCTKKSSSLKEIRLGYIQGLTPSVVKKVSQCFPNISKLDIDLENPETLQEVFVSFPNIEELRVSFCCHESKFNFDSILSGLSKRACRRINKHCNFENTNLKNLQHGPSILNLSKLKKFILRIGCQDCPENDDDAILTDFAAHFVFLKMTSLKELHICDWRFKMSKEYLDLLREKFRIRCSYYCGICE